MTHGVRFGLFVAGLVGLGMWLMATPAESAVNQVTVGSFFYEDATEGDGKIEANVGDQLQFVFVDNGRGSPHTVEIDALGIHSGNVGTGGTFTTPPLSKPGTYRVYCKPHENRGHFTTLIVHGDAEPPPETTTTSTTSSSTTTSTTAAATTTMATSTTGVPAGTTTTTPGAATSTSSVPQPTTTVPGEPSSSTTTPAEPSASQTDGAAPGSADPATALAPTGVGSIDLEAVGITVPPSPREEALGRPVGDDAPWTRSVWFGLLSLIPIAGIATAASLRHRNRTDTTNH